MLLQAAETPRDTYPAPADRSFAAFLLFDRDDDIDEARILEAVRRRARDLGAPFRVSPTTERRLRTRKVEGTFHRRPERVALDIQLSTVKLTVTVSSGPGDRGVWERYLDPDLWPDAFEAIGRERVFVAVLERGDVDGSESAEAAYDRALATTLAADAVAGLDEPLAVLWHPARHALPPARFYRAIRSLAQQRSPLELWTCLRPLAAGPDQSDGVVTDGLLLLLGREIEVLPSTMRTERVARIAIELAAALLDDDAAVGDGDCWTGSQPDAVRVTLGHSRTRADVPVLQLSPLAVGHA